MTWVRLEEGFPDHPKVARAGPLAAWLHVCALCYCNRYLTDGFVPSSQLERLARFDGIHTTLEVDLTLVPVEPTSEKLALILVDVGLWEGAEGGYRVHDYAQYQPRRRTILEQRRADRERKRLVRMTSNSECPRGFRPEAGELLNALDPREVPVPELDPLSLAEEGGLGGGEREEPDEEPAKSPRSDREEPAESPSKSPRDELWDLLVEELGEPLTRSERGRRNSALKELRDIGATPDELRRRIRAYRERWPKCEVTATALTRHWSLLTSPPPGLPLSREERVRRHLVELEAEGRL